MKGRVLIAFTVMVQILAPTAAFSDDESKWASGRDPIQEFFEGIGKSLTGLAKSVTGGNSATSGDEAAWGSRRGAWDNVFGDSATKNKNQDIVTVEGQKKYVDSKGVVVKASDGTRVSRRAVQSSGLSAAPLKKYIDGGGSSYTAGAMSSGAGSSHYYAMGAGIRGGARGSWGGYGESSGARLGGSSYYGFGSHNEGPKTVGAWGGNSGGSSGGFGSGGMTASSGFGRRSF